MQVNQLKHRVETRACKNGSKIINVHIDGYPLAVSSVWLNAGSSSDPLDKLGLAHFFEHLFFTRTKNYPDKQKRLEEIERHGMIFDAFTALEYQHYFYLHLPDQSRKALEFIVDGLTDTIFDNEDLNREKEIVISEEKQNHNDPGSYIWRLANKGLWGEQLLGKDFYGNEETIKNIDLKDLQDFFARFCRPENLNFVFINSDLTANEQGQLVEKIKDNAEIKNSSNSGTYKKVNQRQIFEKSETENSQLALTFLADKVNDVKEKAIQDFICDYFASGWTSRLIQRMRIKENLTYWVYSDSANLNNTGYIRFTLLTAPENVNKVISIFNEEAQKLKNGVSDNTLSMHKTKFIADVLRNSTQYGWLMNWYGFTALLSGKPFGINEYLNEIERLDTADLQKFAKNYLTEDRFSVAYIASERISFDSPTFR